ncbi:flippase [Vibrio sp. YYF0003]|uniref:flippase n=1 Tax=Vibrio sp. YYF0003 TaxID=3116646 RepID=UPI002E9F35B2|nr:flippase [Vibrio sp. YYF0003]
MKIPLIISRSISSKENSNILWLLSEKGINLLLVLLSNVLIARYLGPDNFGKLSLLISINSMVVLLSPIGVNAIFIKEYLNSKAKSDVITTSIFVRFMGGVLFSVVLLFVAHSSLVSSIDSYWIRLTIVSALASAFYLADFLFQAKVESKYAVLARVINVILFFVIKCFLIFSNSPLDYFFYIAILEPTFLSFWYMVALKISKFSSDKGCIQIDYAIQLIRKSKWLLFSTIASVICLKIDQFMLAEMKGDKEVGIYSVAVRLSEVWYFLPNIIAASYFPKLIKAKKNSKNEYTGRLQEINDFLVIVGSVIAIFIAFLANQLVVLLFGPEYSDSGLILSIHVFGGIFVFSRALFSKWIINEGIYHFSLINHTVAALSNVVLNLILIPSYGAIGAAWATVLGYLIAYYFFLALNKRTRSYFIVMTRSFNFISAVRRVFKNLKSRV